VPVFRMTATVQEKKSARHNTSPQHNNNDGDAPLAKAMVSQGPRVDNVLATPKVYHRNSNNQAMCHLSQETPTRPAERGRKTRQKRGNPAAPGKQKNREKPPDLTRGGNSGDKPIVGSFKFLRYMPVSWEQRWISPRASQYSSRCSLGFIVSLLLRPLHMHRCRGYGNFAASSEQGLRKASQ